MRTRLPLLLTLLLALGLNAAAGTPSLADLTRRYARDDQRIAGALRYDRTNATTHEQVWVLETGDVLKVCRESHDAKSDTLEEFSIDDNSVYFAFRKITEALPAGGARVTEERTYLADFATLQKTRRSADFAPGLAAEIPAEAPAEKLDITKLSNDERIGAPFARKVTEITEAVRIPDCLVHNPAKDAPAQWQRIKLVGGSLSPNGRYALAWAPVKKDFVWDDYKFENSKDGYWVEPEAEDVVNFIADLTTHRCLGKTTGIHFGTRQRYNHRGCEMAWSPDSLTFIELNTEKWTYASCCIGHITADKLAPVRDLGTAATACAKEFLKTSRHAGYRRHAQAMIAAIGRPQLRNDGSGSLEVTFQVPKLMEADADVTVGVRFRLDAGKNRLDMLGAALVADP